MKKIIAMVAMLFSLPCLVFANVPNDTVSKNEPKNMLVVMLAKQGSIKATDQAGVYKLTLKGVNPKVIYFSNIPARVSGQFSTEKFLRHWDKNGSFSKTAPNAVMEAVKVDSHHKLDKAETTYAITLDKPNYVSKHTGTLSFEVHALPGTPSKLPSMENSDYVAIFIDDVCLSCIG